jgi:hypothetical protein
MSESRWRAHAAPIIAQVLRATAGSPEKEIGKALRLAYPFGEYGRWPLKIWRDEIKRQRGLKPKLGSPAPADARQGSLFGDGK